MIHSFVFPRRLRWCPALLLVLVVAACSRDPGPAVQDVLERYRELAHAGYADARDAVVELESAVEALTVQPGPASLARARQAWVEAKAAYSLTEALRFGHWFVDEWETRVNAWPLDEGFLDYVADPSLASVSNPHATANLIASETIDIGGRQLRLEPLNRRTLLDAQSLSDVEANVATGFHAIEFMLWGQDLNGNGPGAGDRPWTDFASGDGCTDGPRPAPPRHCRRRQVVLTAATELLRLDLQGMTATWGPQAGSFGDRLVHGDPDEGLRRLLFGLATLAGEELAGERIRVALVTRAPEEEQDCFSDQTHRSLWFNTLGIERFYYGDGAEDDAGPGVAELARVTDPELADALDAAFAASRQAMQRIFDAGERGERFDQLIAPDNLRGSRLLSDAASALTVQSALLTRLGIALGLGTLNPQAPQPGDAP